MATQIGTGHIHSVSGAALSCTLSGYVSPNIQTLRISHSAEVDPIKGQAGNVTGLIAQNDVVECTFDVIPEGTTIANAKKSAGVPSTLAGFTVTGLPIIAFGPFTDVFNTDGTNTQPWIYEGGASINGAADGKYTLSLPMKRYTGITSATAIT